MIKDFEMRKLSGWSQSGQEGSYKREARGSESLAGGRSNEPRNAGHLEAGKGEKMDYSLEPPEEMQPYFRLLTSKIVR